MPKFRVSKEAMNEILLLRRKVWEKQQHARRKKFTGVLGKRESWVRGRSEKDWRWEEKKKDLDVKKV